MWRRQLLHVIFVLFEGARKLEIRHPGGEEYPLFSDPEFTAIDSRKLNFERKSEVFGPRRGSLWQRRAHLGRDALSLADLAMIPGVACRV